MFEVLSSVFCSVVYYMYNIIAHVGWLNKNLFVVYLRKA